MDPAQAWLLVFIVMTAAFFLVYRETREWKTAAIASSILGKTGALGMTLYGLDRPLFAFYTYSRETGALNPLFTVTANTIVILSLLATTLTLTATHPRLRETLNKEI